MKNSTIQSIIILTVSLSVLFYSCADSLHPVSYYAYTPFPVNAPLLKEKNEIQIRAQLIAGLRDPESDKGKVRGGNLQAAYAVSNHIGIIGSYTYSNEFEDYNTGSSYAETISYKKNMAEIGAGYFTPVSKNKRAALEVYAGYSAGQSNIENEAFGLGPAGEYSGRIQRFYVQPAFALHITQNLRMGFLIRTSFMKFRNGGTYYPDDKLREMEQRHIAFLEPSFVIQFPVGSLNWIRGHVQITRAIKIANKDVGYREGVGSIGLTIIPLQHKK